MRKRSEVRGKFLRRELREALDDSVRKVSTGVFCRCAMLPLEQSAKNARHRTSGFSSHRRCMIFPRFGSSSVF